MTENLPSYLQKRSTPAVAFRAAEGMGGALPPHVSIRGNRFTLVDAGGNKQPIQELFMDGCFVDVSDVMCKQYYENPDWTPDSNDPPTCWSANGLAPSREAATPQSNTCANCDWNVRGSAQSKRSGASIKACRDEKWTAFAPLKFPGMLFQLKITPGSFKAWGAYVKKFENQTTDLSDVVTRVSFEADTNGQLLFEATAYIDEATYRHREAVLLAKSTDVLVGRNDQPRQTALPAPQEQNRPLAPAPMATPQTQTVLPAQGASPSEPQAPARRTRRTAAQIAADKAAAGRPLASAAGNGPAAPAGAPVAPFRPATEQPSTFGSGAAGPAPAGGGFPPQPANFGIAPGVAPNPELQATLNSVFGKS